MTKMYISVLLIAIVCVENCWTYTAPYRRPCKDLSPECIKKSIQAALPLFAKGLPEIGVEPLDPYVMDQLNLTLGGGITIQFSHGYAKGLKKCIVDFARLEGDKLETQMHCNLTIKGKYKSSGELFMFPINGDGDSTIKCHNLKLHIILKWRTKVAPDGHQYLDIVSSKTAHSFDGRVTYSMTNLFKGNPGLSKLIVDFMNENWKLIAEEFGKPIVDFGVNSVSKNIKNLFEHIPLSDLQ